VLHAHFELQPNFVHRLSPSPLKKSSFEKPQFIVNAPSNCQLERLAIESNHLRLDRVYRVQLDLTITVLFLAL
jgi:hypothetical protein